jgi:hypothetical protein
MGKDILSVQFGSLDYSDEKVLAAIAGRGLKDRSTTSRMWGQIVTAVKMVWWIMTLPVVWPCTAVKNVVMRTVRTSVRLAKWVKSVVVDLKASFSLAFKAYWRSYNKRTKFVGILVLILSFLAYGFVVMFMWMGCIVLYVFCTTPTDLRFYLKLIQKIQDAWDDTEETSDDMVGDEKVPMVVRKGRTKFACRLAARAISRVGMLRPTRANALVYQKVLLDEMRSLNVRFGDRVRVLPLAVAACLERPAGATEVEEAVDLMVRAYSEDQ